MKPCPHCMEYVAPRLRVIEGAVNCEVTALFCPTCETRLSEPKTECR